MIKNVILVCLVFFLNPFLAYADLATNKWRFGIYGGFQDTSPSRVSTFSDNGTAISFDAEWDAKPLSMPPYWGIRTSFWDTQKTAWEIDFVHSKAYANSKTLTQNSFDHLQFTDGINVLSISRIWQLSEPKTFPDFLPYGGLGSGISLPYVEIIKSTNPSIARTMEYQFGGLSGQAQFGVRYSITRDLNVIFEYKITHVGLNVETAASQDLKTNLVTNALNVGLEF